MIRMGRNALKSLRKIGVEVGCTTVSGVALEIPARRLAELDTWTAAVRAVSVSRSPACSTDGRDCLSQHCSSSAETRGRATTLEMSVWTNGLLVTCGSPHPHCGRNCMGLAVSDTWPAAVVVVEE